VQLNRVFVADEESSQHRELQKWPGYLWRVFACIPVVTIPLLIGAQRTTSVMAMVVDARAFGAHN
jgi:energy-coupling factor transport system permease protein